MINKKFCKNYKQLMELFIDNPKRKETSKEVYIQSQFIEDMDKELQTFQQGLLKGEKLSPI